MSRWGDINLDEWKLQIAEGVAEGKSILEAAGRDWNGDVNSQPPRDPSPTGRSERSAGQR
jgi:hypothetical protein